MLLAALETEAADYVERHRHERDESGRALVVHNGQSHGRKLTLGAGTLELKAPRVNDRRRMRKENPLWGAPRIHGEMLMLGIEVAEATVARYMTSGRGHPPRVGIHSCAITLLGSRPSICSWFAVSPSSCSTAW